MSLRLCAKCGVPLKDGDKVKVMIFAVYKDLRSQIHWAVEKPYDSDEDTLAHVECPIGRND